MLVAGASRYCVASSQHHRPGQQMQAGPCSFATGLAAACRERLTGVCGAIACFCAGTLQEPIYTGTPAKTYPFELDTFQKTSVACLVRSSTSTSSSGFIISSDRSSSSSSSWGRVLPSCVQQQVWPAVCCGHLTSQDASLAAPPTQPASSQQNQPSTATNTHTNSSCWPQQPACTLSGLVLHAYGMQARISMIDVTTCLRFESPAPAGAARVCAGGSAHISGKDCCG